MHCIFHSCLHGSKSFPQHGFVCALKSLVFIVISTSSLRIVRTTHVLLNHATASTPPSATMIRSRSIPAVLSRVAGDGIHAILLIDANGELLGSHGSPPPPPPKLHIDNNGGGGESCSSVAMEPVLNGNDDHWPLDAASIGALISEVAGDYRRMGEELLFLDPEYDLFQQGSLQRQDSSNDGGGGEDGGGSTSAGVGANGKDKSGTNLKTLVIELDYVSAYKQNLEC